MNAFKADRARRTDALTAELGTLTQALATSASNDHAAAYAALRDRLTLPDAVDLLDPTLRGMALGLAALGARADE
ncbi:hypothetical protein [Curtobacterium sp. MCBD17_019]|uniref:hypothetical protein n=1 Tax=Curtobacterium sp. MCBD17_019 TaxID=2175669 RepID=UPI0011B6DA97|nr:hypothetical protein [Curtobacterium sp. MCBD17_019]